MIRHLLPALCALVATLCLASAGRAATLTLAPGQEGAIWTAKAGDTVVLKGVFPYFRLTGKTFDPPLTIDATEAVLTAQGAPLGVSSWYWLQIDGLVLKGGALSGFRIDNAKNVTFDGPTLAGTLVLNGAANVAIRNVTAAGLSAAVSVERATHVEVRNVACTAMTGDCLQLKGVTDFHVDGLTSQGSVPSATAHPDAIQTETRAGFPLRGVIENVRISGRTQGVFLDVGDYVVRNVTAEVGYVHALSINPGSTAKVGDVAVSTLPGAPYQARATLKDLASLEVTGPVTVAAYGTNAGWSVPLTVTSPPVAVEPAPTPDDPRDAQIAALEAQVATLSGRVDALTGQLATATTDAAALRARIDRLAAERTQALALARTALGQAKQARAAKAKNQYIDQALVTLGQLDALLSAPAP